MANYLSDRTGAQIDAAMDAADAALSRAGGTMTGDITTSTALSLNTQLERSVNGNTGTTSINDFSGDVDTLMTTGSFAISSTATNAPVSGFATIQVTARNSSNATQLYIGYSNNQQFFRVKTGGLWLSWIELLNASNIGISKYSDTNPDGSIYQLNFALTGGAVTNLTSAVSVASEINHISFVNPNGSVGSIKTSGTATSYNTSSDPRLKDFKDAPSDAEINTEFSNLYDCFRVFNWKNDLGGDLVWGFDAHACIDANTNVGSEGEGPRDLALGDVYKTTDATYKSIDSVDADGNFTGETEEVELTPEIEHKVSPAGVDQSKAVPILLAKLEQLERRLTAAGL